MCQLLVKPRINMCAGLGVDDVPQFGLTTPIGLLIVRMNLDGQVIFCVYEFDKQREFLAETFVQLFAEDFLAVVAQQAGDCHARQWTFGYDCFHAFERRYFPAFAYVGVLEVYVFELSYVLSAPADGAVMWRKTYQA